MRNVVLVSIDSLRADHCGFMGYERDPTPTLDAMAESGLVFENAIAPGPSTYESMPAVFTGKPMVPDPPFQEGEKEVSGRTRLIRLNMQHETFPEWFDRHGYSTAAFTSNPYTGGHTRFAGGFDTYRDFLNDKGSPVKRKLANLPVIGELENAYSMINRDRASRPWQSFHDDIVDWVRAAPEPYFLWVFLLEPHTPYLVEKEALSGVNRTQMYYHNWKLWLSKKWKVPESVLNLDSNLLTTLYDLTIESADDFLKRLLDGIEATDPAVVVHADHGEQFNEHGLYGHRDHLYEENVHVPLVVYNASVDGQRTEPVSLTAIPDLLKQLASTDVHLPRHELVSSRALESNKLALRTSEWKYIATLDARNRIADEEVYNLSEDENEQKDLTHEAETMVTVCRDLVRRRIAYDTESKIIGNTTYSIKQRL